MERAVRRSELRSPESTPEPASDPEVIQRLRGLGDFNYVDTNDAEPATVLTNVEDEELEFQLFATVKPAAEKTATANKIRLRSPTPQTTDPGFVDPRRPSSHYFADSAGDNSHDTTALSGAQVLALSRTPWPGSVYPWKVLHLLPSNQSREARMQANTMFGKLLPTGAGDPARRKRLGKKARIKVRNKLAAVQSKAEQAKIDAEAKEAALREKRTRLNREKKVKKRMKEKAKKAEAKQDGLSAPSDSD